MALRSVERRLRKSKRPQQAVHGSKLLHLSGQPFQEIAAGAARRYTPSMATLTQAPIVRAEVAQRSLAVLLVEDEVLIRMTLSDMLEKLGHRVAGEAGDIESGSSFAMTGEYDLAILDINLHGRYIDPVADLIALRGKPFIFASGYGPEVLPSLLRRRPLLRKPVSLDDLSLTIGKIFEA